MQVGAMAGGNLAKKREKMAKMHLHLKKKKRITKYNLFTAK